MPLYLCKRNAEYEENILVTAADAQAAKIKVSSTYEHPDVCVQSREGIGKPYLITDVVFFSEEDSPEP